MIDNPQNFQTEIVDEINKILDANPSESSTLSEMSYKERCFLNGIIRQTKPKKILEVGVSAGGSSALILNATKDFGGAKLYSVDYNEKWYRDNTKRTGFVIDEQFAHFKDRWQLYTGGTAAKFMEIIGGDIDLCLIDTAHINPGEFLDFLIVLPYLKKNAILVLHDTCLYSLIDGSLYATGGSWRNICYTNGVLFSCLKGQKFTFNENLFYQYANIGATILDESQNDKLLDYLYLLTLPWYYLPSDNDILECQNLFKKNYGDDFADRFLKIMLFNKEIYLKRNAISTQTTRKKKGFKHKIITALVSLIPSRKIRQKLYNPYY